MTPAINLLAVTTTPAIINPPKIPLQPVHSNIFGGVFLIIWNGFNGKLGSTGDTDSWKKPRSWKSRVRLHLNSEQCQNFFSKYLFTISQKTRNRINRTKKSSATPFQLSTWKCRTSRIVTMDRRSVWPWEGRRWRRLKSGPSVRSRPRPACPWCPAWRARLVPAGRSPPFPVPSPPAAAASSETIIAASRIGPLR